MMVIGAIALVAAAVCAVLAHRAQGRVRAMTTAETLPVGELRELHRAAADAAGEGNFRYRCEVVGVAQASGSGELTAELSGTACVWHRHTVTHKYWETTTDSEGNRKRQERSSVVSQHISGSPFAVRDDTGEITVDPAKNRVDGAEKVLDRFERGGRTGAELRIGSLSVPLTSGGGDTIGYQHEEWVLPAGRRLYVLGEVSDAGGSLVIGEPEDGGHFIVSTRSEEELVRSGLRQSTGLRVAAACCAGLGVVLLVLGLLG
ncbi:E3 ubiquitin ligase family protein [Streptomyces sodiiphilus]|uniref:RING-type E3 ubiquitin transferase n=1 Tax=Streptomyces sodiiphilus TaxID=226217 RepID=A0ABN2NW68_9ACTN